MSRPDRLPALLGTLLALAALLTFLTPSDRRSRNFEFLPDMVEPVPIESQAASALFADGLATRTPPRGTIPRGLLPLFQADVALDLTSTPFADLSEAQRRAWDEFVSPATNEERGAFVFAVFCSVCHGPGGAGDGEATRRGVPPPPALDGEGARGMSDGQLFRILTAGQGNMASYASQIGREDRWNVIRHIRKLQGR